MKLRRVTLFVIAVDLVAAVGTVTLIPYHVTDYLLGLSLLASFALMTGTGPVRIPSTKISVSVSDVFVFTALGAFGPMPACCVAAAGVLGATFREASHRKPIHVAFNMGNVLFSSVAASAGYLLAGGVAGGDVRGQIGPLLAATTVYFMFNTMLVSTAVLADTGNGFWKTWKETVLWTALSTYAGMTLAGTVIWAIQIIGPSAMALGLPPCWLLAAFYRTHKERQLAAQQSVEQFRELNLGLEDKVADRTRELQEALRHLAETNQQLRGANRKLQEANLAKSLFLANISHELRTPLNAVIGFSDLLTDASFGELNEQQSGFVRDIQESGEHLLHLINEILDLTKVDAGKMEARMESVEISKSMQEAVSMVRPQASSKQLRIVVACAEDAQVGMLDPKMFRQVLVNLLSNAVKFTPDEGKVRVTAQNRDGDLLVEVSDTGIGIAQEDMQRIFEEFYQVDGSYSRNYRGTGLGLALVRRMVSLQQGVIDVDSIPGHGSTFRCRFAGCLSSVALRAQEHDTSPMPEGSRLDSPESQSQASSSKSDPSEPDLVEPPPPVPRESDGRTVLVVEDNQVNRKLVRNVLRSKGYRVLEAATGEEALKLLKEQPADVVLMDIQLPVMDGFEVTRRIKADPQLRDLPIVALTAHVGQDDEQRAREAGCVGFLTKPIRLARLPSQVAEFAKIRDPAGATGSRTPA
jgi:signal transduction histidine kinase